MRNRQRRSAPTSIQREQQTLGERRHTYRPRSASSLLIRLRAMARETVWFCRVGERPC